MTFKSFPAERPSDQFLYAPGNISELYDEAANAIAHSPRASAILSRACLEAVLTAMGYKGNLQSKINSAMWEENPRLALSSALRQSLPIIRFIGNCAAHSSTRSTSRLSSIEEEEAEWCLEILTRLLQEHYDDSEFSETRVMAYVGQLAMRGIIYPSIY